MVHSDNRVTSAITLGLFGVGVAASLLLILAHDRPFTGELAVSPDPLLQVMPPLGASEKESSLDPVMEKNIRQNNPHVSPWHKADMTIIVTNAHYSGDLRIVSTQHIGHWRNICLSRFMKSQAPTRHVRSPSSARIILAS